MSSALDLWKGVVFVIVLAGFSIWDIYLLHAYGPDTTVSRDLLVITRDYPVVLVVVGVLLGHLFWPQIVPAHIR